MSNHPVIPQGEFKLRKEKVQQLMAQHGIDLLFFFGDDRAVFGANHTRWLTNYAAHFEPILTGVPSKGDIHSATGAESENFYQNTAKIGQIHVVNEFNMPEEEYPYTINSFKFEITDSDKFELDYRLLRAGKSEAEIAVLSYGMQIAEAGLEAGINALKVGVTEREVAAEIEYVMRKLGSEGSGIDTIVGFGRANTFPILTRTTFNKLSAGDLALLTIAPRYEGYHGVIGRPIAIGEQPKEIKHAIEAAIKASNASEQMLKVGAVGRDISKAGLDVLKAEGLIELCRYSGIHSIGTSEFEPPILTSTSDFVLPNNSFISIDVPLFMTTWGGFRVETAFMVSDQGNKRFSKRAPEYIQK